MTDPLDRTYPDDESEDHEPLALPADFGKVPAKSPPLTPAEQEAALDEQIERWEELESNRGFGEPDEFRDDLM